MRDAITSWFLVNIALLATFSSIHIVALFVSFFRDSKIQREEKARAVWYLVVCFTPITIVSIILARGLSDQSEWAVPFALFSLVAWAFAGIGLCTAIFRFSLLSRLDGWLTALCGKIFPYDRGESVITVPIGPNFKPVTEGGMARRFEPTT